MVLASVRLLDGTKYEAEISKNSNGQILFDKVCEDLNIIEWDYFSLSFNDGVQYWINNEKKIAKQIGSGPWVFQFEVKFYPTVPSQLVEDITRYQLCLQIRVDILNGKLPCTFITSALLGSYSVQAELGDFDAIAHKDSTYLKDFSFIPNQTAELLDKVADLHKTHRHQTPEEADGNFLENARKLSMYGVDLHPGKDSHNKDVNIGVCASRLMVYQDRLRIQSYTWPRIIKFSYKRNNFYIKVRPSEMEQFDSTVSFKLKSHRLAKRLWRVAVEHHTFFRMRETEKPKGGTAFPKFGSRFRYSGRTQYQTRIDAEGSNRKEPNFIRGSSWRPGDGSLSEDNIAFRKQPARATMPADDRDRMSRIGGVPTVLSTVGPLGATQANLQPGDANRHGREGLPDAADRHDMSNVGDATAEAHPGGVGDESTNIHDAATLPISHKKTKEDKEREKELERERKAREKEEAKRRKEEEKLAKKKAKKPTTEDRHDKKGADGATQEAEGAIHPDSAGLNEGEIALSMSPQDVGAGDEKGKGKKDKKGGISARFTKSPKDAKSKEGEDYPANQNALLAAGTPKSGIEAGDNQGYPANHPDYSENSIDRKMTFISVTAPAIETRPLNAQGLSDVNDGADPSYNTDQRKRPPPVPTKPKKLMDSTEDRNMNIHTDIPPTVPTQSFLYNPYTEELAPMSTKDVPFVKTVTRKVSYENGLPYSDDKHHSYGRHVQTVETTTYQAERDGSFTENSLENNYFKGDNDDDEEIDHDAALSEAIRAVTGINPDLSVETLQINESKDI